MTGSSYIVILTILVLAITFSGLHVVIATEEKDSNVIQLRVTEQ